jgi:hypothetical protein
MLSLISILYGAHIIAVVYLISFVAVKGCFNSGAIPFYLVVGKYILYWQLMVFGFKHLHAFGIIAGMVGATYLSLPLLYWVNKKIQSQPQL